MTLRLAKHLNLALCSQQGLMQGLYRSCPWLKLLWESYRMSLEALKNNAHLEVIFQVKLSTKLIMVYSFGSLPFPSKLLNKHSNSASNTNAKSSSVVYARHSVPISQMLQNILINTIQSISLIFSSQYLHKIFQVRAHN